MSKSTFEFLACKNYPSIGYCWFRSENFATFLHETPATATLCETMLMNNWMINTQPIEIFDSVWRVGKYSYCVTWRRIDEVPTTRKAK